MRTKVGNRGLDDSNRIDSRMVVENNDLRWRAVPSPGTASAGPVALRRVRRACRAGGVRSLQARASRPTWRRRTRRQRRQFACLRALREPTRTDTASRRTEMLAGRARAHAAPWRIRPGALAEGHLANNSTAPADPAVRCDRGRRRRESGTARKKSRRSVRRDAARSARKFRRRAARHRIPSQRTRAGTRRRRDFARAIRGFATRSVSSSPDSVLISVAAARRPSLLPHV